jgi:polar amino acid transport system permease protein
MTFDVAVIAYGLPILLKGLVTTIFFCSISIVCGLALGSAIAIARMSRRAVLRHPALWFIEVIRNTPFLVQAFLVYFALPPLGLRLSATTAGIIVLSSYASAYFAEAIRGAILSVPRGQMESARAVGLPYLTAMLHIIFPQMLGYLIPALTNQMIGVIKESAVLSVITVPELTMAAQFVLGNSFSPVETFVMVALLYWALTASLASAMLWSEKRFVHADREAGGRA